MYTLRLPPRQASISPFRWPAQNISSCNSTRILFWLCHLLHSALFIKGTSTFWSTLVPVFPAIKCKKSSSPWPTLQYKYNCVNNNLPYEVSVFPHPATTPTLPSKSFSSLGKQMGKILALYRTGLCNRNNATSNLKKYRNCILKVPSYITFLHLSILSHLSTWY